MVGIMKNNLYQSYSVRRKKNLNTNMKYNYIELVTGTVKNRGSIVCLPDSVDNTTLDYYGKEVVNGFHSTYMHTEDIKKLFDSTGSIRGYDGYVYNAHLFWDIDNEKSLKDAITDTIELVKRIQKYTTNYRIYFSGCKGFHVIMYLKELEILSAHKNFNNITKTICTSFADGLESFDNKVYDKTRLIRTPNSKHSKTGLYKVELLYSELVSLSPEQITQLAKNQRHIDFKYSDVDCSELMMSFEKQFQENIEVEKKRSNLNVQEIINGVLNGFDNGSRNSALCTIAGMLHKRNIDEDIIRALCYSINSKNEVPLSEIEVDNIVRSVSRYPVDQKYSPVTTKNIVGIEEAGEAWYHIIKHSGYCSFGERFKHLNDRMKLCIPGDAIAIVANSGVGKSSAGLELGNEEAKSRNVFSLIASLEMSKAGIFFRTATIEALGVIEIGSDNYVPSTKVAESLLNDTTLRDKVYDHWKHIKIVDEGGMSLDKIVEYFSIAQDVYHNKIGNLVIDYAQNLDGAEDITYAMAMARRLKEVAKQLNTKLFVLMQCNKTIPDEYTEVQKNHIEGAGAYYQAMDYIIGMWRDRQSNNRLHAKLLKDRWGSSDYYFDMVRNGLKYHTEDYTKQTYFSLPNEVGSGFSL